MVFVHPNALWMLLLVLPLVAVHVRHRSGLTPLRVAGVTALRVVAFVLLVLALAQPVVKRGDPSRTWVAVVDLSESVEEADLASVEASLEDLRRRTPPGDDVKLVVFDRTARRIDAQPGRVVPGELASLRAAGVSPRSDPTAPEPGSALSEALHLAGALIPHDGRGDVQLFTDGLVTDGDARAAAYRLAQRGIGVSVTPVGGERTEETILCGVAMPATGGIGATVTLAAEIESSARTPAEIIARCENTGEEKRIPVTLSPGRQQIACPCPLRQQGVNRYTVRVDARTDTRDDNNVLSAAIYVEPPTEVRVLEDQAGTAATAALASLLGLAATVKSLTPDDLSDLGVLDDADVLVMADVPAEAMTPETQRRIAGGVVEGLGLLVTGGRRSFGPGGYANTPLADVLPVRFAQKVERRDPSTTLVVIIDTSGSMGGPRVNLAKEIARLAIARLKPHDKVGIVEFYGSKRWAAPIQPASNAIDVQRALNRLSAGGGTIILPAIEEAYYALQNVRTRTKHVLVLTDGGVEPGAFEPLIRKMAESGITLSTVLVGPGMHSAFLASLAHWGRGRFYAAPDRFNLPEIIIKQPESSLLTPFVEQPTRLVCKTIDPIVRGIDVTSAPEIDGYVETEARPTAGLILESSLGHPILARWRYGLGGVAAYTSQIGGEWTRNLSRWPPYAQVFSNLLRSLSRPRADNALRITPVLRSGAIEVQIETRWPASGQGHRDSTTRGEAFAAVELTLTDPTDATHVWTLDPIQPYRWNVRLNDLPPGVYQLDARMADGALAGSAAVTLPPIREVTALGPDHKLLEDIAAMQSLATQRAGELLAVRPKRPYELSPALTGAALALFLLNVLLRRWPTGRLGTAMMRVAQLGLILLAVGSASGDLSAEESVRPPVSAVSGLSPEAIREVEAALKSEDPQQASTHLAQAARLVQMRDGQLDRLVAFLQPRSRHDRQAAMLLARAARWNGDLETARDGLREWAAKDQADAEVWGELARLEEMLGHDQAALSALERAIATQVDPDRRFALGVRRALLSYQGKDAAAGKRALQSVVAERPDPNTASFCAHLAGILGDYALASEWLRPSGTAKQQFHDCLFRGLFLTRMNLPDQAQIEFERAYDHAALSRDRRYALERVVAAARRAGQLPMLAERWLADRQLSADQLHTLVAVLRELDRPSDAMGLLRRPDLTAEQRHCIESPEFQRELIATAVEAGRENEAETAYRSLLEQEPAQVEWRVGLARLMLLDGRRDEATRLFESQVEASDDPRALMALADGARQLALDEAALAAARKAATAGDSYRVRAVLFEADLAWQRGDADRAVSLLQDLQHGVGEDSTSLVPIAEAFERYGASYEALQLFRSLYEKTKGEDALLRVAWLLEQNDRYDEACALWKELWQTTEVPARLQQAEERLLDLAARSGRLADLAIELEERLDEGTGGQRELSLLVDLYTQANDPVSAAEVLQEFSRRSGGQVEMLQRLARVYLSCEQFGRCNAVLRKLATLDPDHAEDYWQQIAMVALERRQPQEAKRALEDLAGRSPPAAGADEFAAGVLDQIGLHEEAVQSYGRVLAKHPDRIEAFLLWGNALRASGQADRAIARFQDLTEEALEDDLFTVAVDGLLNLDASPAVLRFALRRVYTRIAADPDKVFLYRLAVDLLEALGQTDAAHDVLEQAVVVAGERRAALLRELVDGAKAENQTDRVIRFGRSLLALGELVPPQVYLDLGEAMIREGEFASAEQVFDRARVEADFSAIQQRVAECYENAGFPRDADRIIRQLLIAEPDNTRLLLRSGGLCEQQGNFGRAFEQYYRAADLMLRRLPGEIASDGTAETEVGSAANGRRRRPRRALNLSELAQFFDSAGSGLLNAARSPELKERLLHDLSRRVDEELRNLATDPSPALAIARNPRLNQLASFVRRVAFSLHAPDLADGIDRALIKRYERDPSLRNAIVQARVEWGLYRRAASFVDAGDDLADLPIAFVIDRLLADPERLAHRLSDRDIDPPLARGLIPALIMTGRKDEASRALRAVRLDSPESVKQAAPTMIVAAVALDDGDARRQWVQAWLDALAKDGAGPSLTSDLQRCVRLIWNHLTPDDRTLLMDRLRRLSERLDAGARVRLDLVRMQLAQGQGAALELSGPTALAAAGDDTLPIGDLVRVLETVPAAERPGLVRAMAAARRPAMRRQFLSQLAGALTWPADPPLTDAFEETFKTATTRRFEPNRIYSEITAGDWTDNVNQPELGRRIGEILLSESPNNPAVMTVAATTRAHAGRHDEAVLLVSESLEAILASPSPSSQDGRMLDDLARCLRPPDLQTLLDELTERGEIEGVTAMNAFARGVLLEAANQPAKAAAAFQAAYEASPTNPVVRRKLITVFQRLDQPVALSRLLSAHLTRSTIMESLEWRTLATLYVDLYDLPAAARAAAKDETPLAPLQTLRIARMAGRVDELQTMLRRHLIANRREGRFFDQYWPSGPSPHGMLGYLAKETAEQRDRERLFVALADLPFAEAECVALLQAASPGRRDVLGLIAGVLKASALNGSRDSLVAGLLEAEQHDALTATDRQMILAMGEEAPAALPEALAGSLADLLLYTDPTDAETLAAMARMEQGRGRPEQAACILRWVVAYDLLQGRQRSGWEDRWERLNSYLSLLPEEKRKSERRRWLRFSDPTPLDSIDDEFDAALLEQWIAANDRDELDRRVESLRQRITGDEGRPATEEFAFLSTVLARCDAAADRFDAFAHMVKSAFPRLRDDRRRRAPVDCRKLLPVASRLADPARYVDVIVSQIDVCRSEGKLSHDACVRTLCLLGEWCVENGLMESATALLARAETDAGDPGEHWLWIADLARQMQAEEKAIALETRLLEMDRLPVIRVPTLLDDLEARRDRETADALAVRVAGYSDHPAVLRRAIRWADAMGDQPAATTFRQRLRNTGPDEPPKRDPTNQ